MERQYFEPVQRVPPFQMMQTHEDPFARLESYLPIFLICMVNVSNKDDVWMDIAE